MMGTRQPQPELFSYQVDLKKRVHVQHPSRGVLALVDFTFAREEVAHTYRDNGNVSLDPAVLLKLMFLLFAENVRSERELMRRMPPAGELHQQARRAAPSPAIGKRRRWSSPTRSPDYPRRTPIAPGAAI